MKQLEQLGILDQRTQNTESKPTFESAIRNHAPTLENAIQRIFADHTKDTRVAKARRIMGNSLKALSDEEVELYLTEMEHIVDSWFDTFERTIFDNETLSELLGRG